MGKESLLYVHDEHSEHLSCHSLKTTPSKTIPLTAREGEEREGGGRERGGGREGGNEREEVNQFG